MSQVQAEDNFRKCDNCKERPGSIKCVQCKKEDGLEMFCYTCNRKQHLEKNHDFEYASFEGTHICNLDMLSVQDRVCQMEIIKKQVDQDRKNQKIEKVFLVENDENSNYLNMLDQNKKTINDKKSDLQIIVT